MSTQSNYQDHITCDRCTLDTGIAAQAFAEYVASITDHSQIAGAALDFQQTVETIRRRCHAGTCGGQR